MNPAVHSRECGLATNSSQEDRISLAKMKNFADGYAEKIRPSSSNPKFKWYLPHQPAVNPKNPETLRIVFDCGAEYQGMSLNNFLMHRPDLNQSLVSVLTQFRQEKVAIVADVRSMFHQVKVKPQDTDALRFLWWPKGDLKKIQWTAACWRIYLVRPRRQVQQPLL